MTDTEPLFPELVAEVVDPAPDICKTPLFILAYRPVHQRWPAKWKIHCALEFGSVDDPGLVASMQALQAQGSRHLHVLRLPAGGPWSGQDMIG